MISSFVRRFVLCVVPFALAVAAHAEPAIIAKARAFLGAESALDAVKSVHYIGTLVTADPAIHVGRIRIEGKSLQLVAALDNAGRAGDVAASLAIKLAEKA